MKWWSWQTQSHTLFARRAVTYRTTRAGFWSQEAGLEDHSDGGLQQTEPVRQNNTLCSTWNLNTLIPTSEENLFLKHVYAYVCVGLWYIQYINMLLWRHQAKAFLMLEKMGIIRPLPWWHTANSIIMESVSRAGDYFRLSMNSYFLANSQVNFILVGQEKILRNAKMLSC